MQLTTPLVGAVFSIGAILSSCSGDAATESDQAFTNSDAPVGAAIAKSHGGTEGGVCMVERFNATKPANKTSLNCTSNDVQLAQYELVGEPEACTLGEDVTVTLQAEFLATSAERWDVGVFVSQDGLTPNALGGSCYSDYLHPVSAVNTDLDLTGGLGPFYNGEIDEDPGDKCGDIQQGQNAFFNTGTITIKCQDTNNNGTADVGTCTVWANSRSAGTANKPSCIDEGDVTAETVAKCTCGQVEITDLFTGCRTDDDCDDETACTTDVCTIVGNVGTCTNETISCDDMDACTADSCDPATGCVNADISDTCDDSDACTADSCNPETGCVNETISCDDSNICTMDTCDPANGCVNQGGVCEPVCEGPRPKPPKELVMTYENPGGAFDFDAVCITADHPKQNLLTEEMVSDGGTFMLFRARPGLQPRVDLVICGKVDEVCGETCDSFSIHTSCSQPLFIGQRFGTFSEVEVQGQLQ